MKIYISHLLLKQLEYLNGTPPLPPHPHLSCSNQEMQVIVNNPCAFWFAADPCLPACLAHWRYWPGPHGLENVGPLTYMTPFNSLKIPVPSRCSLNVYS